MDGITVIQKISELEREREQLVSGHKRAINELDGRLQKLNKARKLNAAGFDIAKIQLAESIIEVRGNVSDARPGSEGHGKKVRSKAVEDAIRLLADNPLALATNYIGVKNYKAFGDQREDHSNGMGPRHGSIVFSIRRTGIGNRPLTKEEREAAIYYLDNLADIQDKAQEAA